MNINNFSDINSFQPITPQASKKSLEVNFSSKIGFDSEGSTIKKAPPGKSYLTTINSLVSKKFSEIKNFSLKGVTFFSDLSKRAITFFKVSQMPSKKESSTQKPKDSSFSQLSKTYHYDTGVESNSYTSLFGDEKSS